MKSVVDALREEQTATLRALSCDERVDLALRLGDDDLASYCARALLGREAALQQVRMRRQNGRRPSRAASGESSA